MLEFIIAMENETGETCFYYLFTYYVETTPHGQNLHSCIMWDNTGQFMTGFFIVSVQKQKGRKRELGPNALGGM